MIKFGHKGTNYSSNDGMFLGKVTKKAAVGSFRKLSGLWWGGSVLAGFCCQVFDLVDDILILL